MKTVVCIAGPTASGKSACAIELAKTVDGEIINADSMQVYNDLQILSARPSQADMEAVPHHMFGHIDGSIRYSVGQWQRDVVPVILDCLARDKTPILVGGTGLYFKALIHGLAVVPDPDPEAMRQAKSYLAQGIENLRQKAELVDPIAAARVLGDDPQRLLRIVSVALGTDQPLSAWQRGTRPIIPKPHWSGVILMPERQELYERINLRYERMVNEGGLEEARRVAKRSLSPDLPMMRAIGLPPLLASIRGEMSFDEAIFKAKRDTRRFAKRQFTWFRGQSEGWVCVEGAIKDARVWNNIA